MLRFFRKYQKVLLAVGGSILLVIFLVPQAIQGIGNYAASRGRTMGTFVTASGDTREITAVEFSVAQADLAVITRGMGFNLSVFGLLPPVEDARHWVLLAHEAEELGLLGGEDDAHAIASQLGGVLMQMSRIRGVPMEQLPDFDTVITVAANGARVTPQQAMDAFTRIMSVQRMLTLYASTPKISDRRLIRFAGEILQGIDADTLVLTAGDENSALPEPTEADLQGFLDAHGEDEPGAGDRGFGYRLPPRVKIEWLVISEQSLRDKLGFSAEMSPLELRKYWLENKLDFMPLGMTNPNDVEYADVEADVREALLDDLVSRTSDEIVRFAEGEINRQTRALDRAQGFLALPDDWVDERVNLVDLANSIQARFDAGLPEYHRRADAWLSADDLAIEPDLGLARTSALGAPRGLSNLIPLLKEFGGDENGAVFVQEGVTGPVLRSGATAIFYRVIDSDDTRAPANIDEARNALVADFKKAADYDRLVAMKEQIREAAVNRGIEAVGGDYDSFPLPQRNIGWAPDGADLMRVGVNATRFTQPVGRHEEAINTIVARGQELVARMMAEKIAAVALTLDERTMVVEVPDKLSLIVVQFTGFRPLVFDSLRANIDSVIQMIVQDEFDDQPLDFFSEEAMLERYQYENASSDVDEETGEPADPSENGTTTTTTGE